MIFIAISILLKMGKFYKGYAIFKSVHGYEDLINIHSTLAAMLGRHYFKQILRFIAQNNTFNIILPKPRSRIEQSFCLLTSCES